MLVITGSLDQCQHPGRGVKCRWTGHRSGASHQRKQRCPIGHESVVDGAPAARFVRQLLELIESGYGLAEEQPTLHSDNGSAPAQPAAVLA